MSTSCDVRKPSKKCRNGTRARSVAAWATAAKSCASWTLPAASIAHPVVRACITSEWSPKIDRACVATVRAATCIVHGVSSPAILNMFGTISSRPWEAVNVVAKRAFLDGAVQCSRGTSFRLHFDDLRNQAPQVRATCGGPLVGQLSHRRRRGDRIDRNDLAERIGDARRRLVAVDTLHATPCSWLAHLRLVESARRLTSWHSSCTQRDAASKIHTRVGGPVAGRRSSVSINQRPLPERSWEVLCGR